MGGVAAERRTATSRRAIRATYLGHVQASEQAIKEAMARDTGSATRRSGPGCRSG
jgi:hypothetical protein